MYLNVVPNDARQARPQYPEPSSSILFVPASLDMCREESCRLLGLDQLVEPGQPDIAKDVVYLAQGESERFCGQGVEKEDIAIDWQEISIRDRGMRRRRTHLAREPCATW